MELYDEVSYQLSRQLTLRYSSSFGISSRLFAPRLRSHIYAVYGLVRIADEIVDTYKGKDAAKQLGDLEREVYHAIKTQYSVNPIVHAFAKTAELYGIDKDLIAPFFKSMRIDLTPQSYNPALYKEYIHGSAEVVGLMCLKVFCEGDDTQYRSLETGAAALGSAYQKVNFLRDMAADFNELGRVYFPGVNFAAFDETAKRRITDDIRADFEKADEALRRLPRSSRLATSTSYAYYKKLLEKLEHTPAEVIKRRRVRVSTPHKLFLLAHTVAAELHK